MRATTRTSGGWPKPARADRAARSISTAAHSSPRGPSACPDHSETCPRWLEIWNLVFMEFDQRPDGRRPAAVHQRRHRAWAWSGLPASSSRCPTNYDTDLFTPIHARMRELIGHDPEAFEAERFSYQVIADHSRAVTFLIGDDVLPSNEGRGYVLRRILRRAVRHGRLLGRREAVHGRGRRGRDRGDGRGLSRTSWSAGTRSSTSSAARRRSSPGRSTPARRCSTPRRRRSVAATPRPREVGRRLEALPPDAPTLPGEIAFRLHDTYGFPIDLTVELAAEYGVRVDRAGFEPRMAEQRDRSRSGKKAELARHAELNALYGAIQARAAIRRFLGYETTTAEAPGRGDPARRDGVRGADRPRRGRGRARPDAVLRRGRRPGRRPGHAPRSRAAAASCSRSPTPRSRSAA